MSHIHKRPSVAVSKSDMLIIGKIVSRTATLCEWIKVRMPLTLHLDLTMTHANGCQLDLAGLLACRDRAFIEDITGILRHIDRSTGCLKEGFVPRFITKPTA